MTSQSRITVSRRRFLATSAAGLACLSLPPRPARAAIDYEGLQSDDYLGPATIETRIEGDDVFTEGPAVDREGILYFTNIPPSHILRWDPKRKERSVFRENSNKANGLLFDPEGRLLACEGGAGRVTRTDMQSGEIEVLSDTYSGRPLAPPNDLCLDAKGRLYFSSRPGLGDDPEQDNVNAVYRRDPDGSLHRLLHWPIIHMPNGVVLSPDEKTLYLIEAHAEADHHRDVRAYDLAENGSLSNERVLIDFYPGRSGDGMCIDGEGNLYIAAGLHKTRGSSETLDTRPGIHVVSPQGKLLAYRKTPEDTVTNCTFGGPDLRTLYITGGPLLLSMRTQIPGKPSYRPGG